MSLKGLQFHPVIEVIKVSKVIWEDFRVEFCLEHN